MLQTIKMLRKIKDNSKDELIDFYIKEVTKTVLDFCNRENLNDALESFILFKVNEIVKYDMYDENANNSAQSTVITSVHRGDTTITYDTNQTAKKAESTFQYSHTVSLSAKEKQSLTKHRKLKFN